MLGVSLLGMVAVKGQISIVWPPTFIIINITLSNYAELE